MQSDKSVKQFVELRMQLDELLMQHDESVMQSVELLMQFDELP